MARQTCADCGKQSPLTESSQTLISAQHRWRLTRLPSPNGTGSISQWRCPECWGRFSDARKQQA
jgi:hypothetical protein